MTIEQAERLAALTTQIRADLHHIFSMEGDIERISMRLAGVAANTEFIKGNLPK